MSPTTLPSTGLLLLRVVVGVTFLAHGLDKLAVSVVPGGVASQRRRARRISGKPSAAGPR